MRTWLGLAVLLLGSAKLGASPLQEEQGAHGAALAGSATARVLGPSSLYYNPAALPDVAGVAVDIGGAGVFTHHQVHPRGLPSSVTEAVLGRARTRAELLTPPAVFGVLTRGSLSSGIGVYAPLLRTVRWERGWPGRQRVVSMDSRALTVNPVLAYKQGLLSIGMGLRLTGVWTRDEVAASREESLGGGLGFNAAVLLRPVDTLRAGFHYQSRTVLGLRRQDASGRVQFDDEALPDVVRAGIAFEPQPSTSISADVQMTLWTVGRSALTANAATQDALGLRIGIQQALLFVAPDVMARAGLLLIGSPVRKDALPLEAPWGTRAGASLGVGWKIFGVSLAAAYVGDVAIPRPVTVDGEALRYRATTHQLWLSAGYQYAAF